MTPKQALDAIMAESEKVIASEAIGLNTELKIIAGGGMKKTGNFQRGFKIERISKLQWRISNPVEYSSILAGGRRFVNGKYLGSINWAGGLSPMLEKTSNDITRRLDGIRK